MRAVLATGCFALSLIAAVPAQAAHRHHACCHHRAHIHHVASARHHVRLSRRWRWHRPRIENIDPAGLVTVETAAGIAITVAAQLAPRFQALVADFVAAGYRPRHIGCFARGGHVPNSRHYAGAACDFDQRGWGQTVAFMYTARAHEIIVAHGFRDGREFHDQGHVDDGASRYARRSYRSWYGG